MSFRISARTGNRSSQNCFQLEGVSSSILIYYLISSTNKHFSHWPTMGWAIGIWLPVEVILYRVSQEEWTKFRKCVPYVELYRYNPKHLYPKFNSYGDNGLRKVWTSCISAYCTSTAVAHWHWQCNKSSHLCDCTRSAQRDKTVLHYGQIFMRNVKCLVTLRTTMKWVRVFL